MTPQPNDAVTPEFIAGLLAACKTLKTKPEYLLPVMMYESGCMASARNPGGPATGLIQFEPSRYTKEYYGYSRDQFSNLPMAQQVVYVGKYLAPFKGQLTSIGAVYQAVFLPASLLYAKNPEDEVCGLRDGDHYGWAYRANRSFDRAGNGFIAVQDLTNAAVGACRGPRWAEIQAALAAATAPSPPVGTPAPSGGTPEGCDPQAPPGATGDATS